MTGRDLIIYILENNLENKPIFENGKLLGFLTIEETALKFDVGCETIKLWFKLGIISGITIGDNIYILANTSKGVV